MTGILDFHSHILPAVDDGSRSVEESRTMLGMMRRQGTEVLCATPHFHALYEPVHPFLEKRQAAAEKLASLPDIPEIRLGAEVAYSAGISEMKNLEKLCIQGTDFLLVEMPQRAWSDYELDELGSLSLERHVSVVLAHAERCLPAQGKGIWHQLKEWDVFIQCNGEFFNWWRSRKHALAHLQNGTVDFLGSDSHRSNRRKPNLEEAYQHIAKAMGQEKAEAFAAYQRRLFDEHKR